MRASLQRDDGRHTARFACRSNRHQAHLGAGLRGLSPLYRMVGDTARLRLALHGRCSSQHCLLRTPLPSLHCTTTQCQQLKLKLGLSKQQHSTTGSAAAKHAQLEGCLVCLAQSMSGARQARPIPSRGQPEAAHGHSRSMHSLQMVTRSLPWHGMHCWLLSTVWLCDELLMLLARA